MPDEGAVEYKNLKKLLFMEIKKVIEKGEILDAEQLAQVVGGTGLMSMIIWQKNVLVKAVVITLIVIKNVIVMVMPLFI